MSTAGFTPVRRGAQAAWIAALVLAAAACGGVDRPGADQLPGGAPPAAAPASAAPAGESAPAPGLAPPDPLAEVEDSIREADLFRQRQQSMESYESCMRKAKGLEEPARTMIENACKRSRGGGEP